MANMNRVRESAEVTRVATIGRALFDELQMELKEKGVKPHQHIAISINDGGYVLGSDALDVAKRYEESFGTEAPAYTRRIGDLEHV